MPKSHKSQSGPVIVRKVADPQPLTPSQEEARLKHKLALIEDRLADRSTFIQGHYFITSKTPAKQARQVNNLLKQRKETLDALSQIRGVAEEALNHSPAG